MPARSTPLEIGDVLPGTKYRVVKELGAGGMGVVYHVVKPPNINGVLKLMSKDLAATEEFRTRFFDEVRILAQLDHPNIVKVFDYDSLPDGTPYYVMELLQGRTLRDALVTMGRLPPRVAFEITRQLLEALHCAHTHDVPVVHRDIKPENIFLHAPRHGEPVVKLIDFGVIAVADRKHDGMFVGTWRYAAPEQIRGERAIPATDLYAVGLVLYEMLAGRGPFDHYDSGTLVSQAHLRDAPAPISQFAPWVPPSIVELVTAALSKDPRARPRDAYAFAERLYELELASDGNDPHDRTSEGGAIHRVLSTIETARADIPVINVPSENKHRGTTLEGLGGGGAIKEATTPDEDALLEGLVARTPSSPHAPHVVLRPSGPKLDRPPTAATIESDTFASQQSDARAPRARPRRLVVPVAIAGLAVAAAIAFVMVKDRSPERTPVDTSVNAAPPPSASPAAPAPPSADPIAAATGEPPPSASVAPVAKPPTSAPRSHPAPRTTSTATIATATATTTATAAPKPPRDDLMRGGP